MLVCFVPGVSEAILNSFHSFSFIVLYSNYYCALQSLNRFKGLDPMECLMNYGLRFMTLYRRQGSRPSPWKKKCKKSKMAVWRGLTNCCERREVKSKGEKERYKHLNAELQRIARRNKKAFLSYQCKEIEENNGMGKTRDLFKKIRDTREYFMQRWAW